VTPKPAPPIEPEVEKGRRGFFKKLRGGGDQKPELKAKEEDRERARILRVPFVGGKDEERVVEKEQPKPSEKENSKDKRSRLLKIPFVGVGDDSPESVDSKPDAKVEVAKDERSRLLRLPFSKGDEAIEGDTDDAEVVPPKMEKELASKEKKGGFFKRIGGGSEKDKPPPPQPSTRDLGTGEKYVVSVTGTPFYSIGPSQPLPPDQILNEGYMVTMRKAGWGWSDIELPGGRMGVVATKNLRKATAAETGGQYAARRSDSPTRGLFKVIDFNPAPEPELPSDAGGLPLGVGLLPPLDDD
jgi:hypothetical protein